MKYQKIDVKKLAGGFNEPFTTKEQEMNMRAIAQELAGEQKEPTTLAEAKLYLLIKYGVDREGWINVPEEEVIKLKRLGLLAVNNKENENN